MKVSDVLDAKGRQVETASSRQTLQHVIELLARANISSVVIVDQNRAPIGIVTDRIIVDATARHGRGILELTAADVMQVPAPACRAGDSVRRAMEVMTDRRVRHLVVTQDETMVGLVSIGDLVKFRLRDAELENGVLRDLAPVWIVSRAH